MTDTASPITGPHLTPMFATGGQPAVSPNTEPNPAPIFDTGPHPDPLPSAGEADGEAAEAESTDWADAEWDSDEWRSAEWRHPDTDPADAGEASESELARIAASFDLAVDSTGAHPESEVPQAFSELENVDTDAFLRSVTGHIEPVVVGAQPVAVPSAFQFVKRWKFALIVAGVWLVAAAAGLGFYYWWYIALNKTIPVLGILLYLVVCMVASVLVSMVPNRPQVTALAIALMAAPLASMAAAAVLHGAYYFEWIARPIVG